ncbi:NAD-dependent epimerase/dehydratase family protein [Atopomonas hussainii]|uniref:NAD-dependent epimerase/dehydratase family protein n=1 Tax=Atopomonas hussainii TaxID=1429083 RepID=UPI00090042A9|nr:NAD-dependent epimerase/dehydratase family protein [Atopomonas hussainii]
MKVLVTGGLGQIGSHVVEMLLERGDEVVAIDNLATGRREHLAEHDKLRVVIDTIANKELVDQLVSNFRPDAIVHTAASYKDPDDWYNDTLTNCVGGANMVDAAKKFGVGRFVYFQTALCYGLHPLQQPIRLDHPRLPSSSSYSISKTTNEFYLELSGLDYVTFRLANVVGPRNVAGPLPIFYQRLKDGKQCFVTQARRDFVFVKDLARVVVKACDGVGHGAYHFSSGQDIAIQELYDAVVNAMDLPSKPHAEVKELGPDDVFSILLDPSRTFEDFGDIQFTPLQETVSAAIEYYKQHGTLGEYTHLRLQDKQ